MDSKGKRNHKRHRRNQETCPHKMPSALIIPAFINGRHIPMCPLCYAKTHKQIHGQKWIPAEGSVAESMLIEALMIMRKRQKRKANAGGEQ